MEKTPRYTQRERNMVLGFAARHKEIIENKRTDAESNRKKDEVWLQIAKEFNAQAYHQRSAKQLRQLYKNMKLLLKKDLCGEDRGGNRTFMDLLTTLQQQDSVSEYIKEQMSPDSGGSKMMNGSGGGSLNGSLKFNDDYDNSRAPFEAMDTDVILIKSETISDNEQTEHELDGMDDDDDDCLSSRAPEVCLEEEDEELFATDLRQIGSNGSGMGTTQTKGSGLGMIGIGSGLVNIPHTTSVGGSPVPSSKTSASSSTSSTAAAAAATLYSSNTKPEITISNIGGIRVGAFAHLNKALQNSSISNNNNNSSNNTSSLAAGNVIGYNHMTNGTSDPTSPNPTSNNNSANSSEVRQMQLTAEQMQQHLLLNELGLSAVHPPVVNTNSANTVAAVAGAATALSSLTTANNPSAAALAVTASPTHLPIPRLQRSNAGNVTIGGVTAATTVSNGDNGLLNLNGAAASQLLMNGTTTGSMTSHSKTSPHYNGANLSNNHHSTHPTHHHHINIHHSNNHHNLATLNSSNASTIGTHNGLGGSSSSFSTKSQQNEYLMKLTIEERKRKIDLLNAQIEYWQTLTKKLDATSTTGGAGLPSCICHFTAAAAANGLQSQSSNS